MTKEERIKLHAKIRKEKRPKIKKGMIRKLLKRHIVSLKKDGKVWELRMRDGRILRNPSRANAIKDMATILGYTVEK